MIKNIIKYIILVIITMFITYIFIAFTLWEFDFIKYSPGLRLTIIYFGFSAGGLNWIVNNLD